MNAAEQREDGEQHYRYEVYDAESHNRVSRSPDWFKSHMRPDGMETTPGRADFGTLEEAKEAAHRVSYDMPTAEYFYIVRVDPEEREAKVVFGEPGRAGLETLA